METHHRREKCRVCNSKDLTLVFDVGKTPPANAYLSKEQLSNIEEQFPLSIYYCGNCTLVQVLDIVDPCLLFKDYHFITSASRPSVEHFEGYSEMLKERFVSNKNNFIVDIGGNDGVLLSYLKTSGKVLNIDPADNLEVFCKEKEVDMLPDFFSSEIAREVREKYGPANIITANNVTAHIDSIQDVYKGVATLLSDDGVFVAESHWVKNLIENGAFDQIYHEHLCFYSLHALKHLAESVGLSIFDVEKVQTQGESLRIFLSKNREPLPSVKEILDEEIESGLTSIDRYLKFSEKVEENKKGLKKLLEELKKDGKKIVGYGAPAKGNTLLNYYNINGEILDYLTDSTPMKQGLYSPGMHIPILNPDVLKTNTPDYILILAWNYTDAILDKESDLRNKGVKFIVTVPEVKIY